MKKTIVIMSILGTVILAFLGSMFALDVFSFSESKEAFLRIFTVIGIVLLASTVVLGIIKAAK